MKKPEQTFALVVGGIVQNIIVADQSFADLIADQYDAVLPANGTPAYIGGEYRDGVFIAKPAEPTV